MQVKFKKLTEAAIIPSYAKNGDAGLDLTVTNMEVKNNHVIYGCGLCVEIPEGYVGLIFPRSSIKNYDLLLTNSVGVIDSGYRGEIKAVFERLSGCNIYQIGDRFCQLIIIPYPKIEAIESTELNETDRGNGGYGSSGK